MSRDILIESAAAPVVSTPAQAGTPGAAVTAGTPARRSALAEEVGARAGVKDARPSGWFTKLIGYYLRRYKDKDAVRGRAHPKPGQSVTEAARSRIFRASVKSAVSGSLAGSLTTAATLITAETEGLAGLVAIPVAALGIGGEMMYRSLVHFDLTVQLADLFGVEFDPSDPADIMRLYSLVFKTGEQDGEDGASSERARAETPSLGRDLVHKVKHLESSEVGEQIGNKVLGESVVRNIIPFVSVVSSAVTNFVLTQRLGHTVRRYMRYQRAIDDAFDQAANECKDHLELLVEGIWFIFTADGRLQPEETVTLVKLLERLDPEHVIAALIARDIPAVMCADADAIVAEIAPKLRSGDVVAILSNGGFGGIYEKLPMAIAPNKSA